MKSYSSHFLFFSFDILYIDLNCLIPDSHSFTYKVFSNYYLLNPVRIIKKKGYYNLIFKKNKVLINQKILKL